MNPFEPLFEILRRRTWTDFVELAIIGAGVYSVMRFLKGTRGARLLRGFLLLLLGSTLVLNFIANAFDLERIKTIYPLFVGGLFLSALVAFQIELRRALIRLGAATWFGDTTSDVDRVINETVDAAVQLSKRRMGAIIAFERATEFRALEETGIRLDAELSKELLLTIFWPGTPLHDMGVIVSQGRITAAAVQFPLADAEGFDAAIGARHRAALGLSQESDALILVVSEETGAITIVEDGTMQRNLTAEKLRDILQEKLGGSESTDVNAQKRMA
ncbi:MAG: diadenylate cyclase CdaA [Planctomycetota bacterium]